MGAILSENKPEPDGLVGSPKTRPVHCKNIIFPITPTHRRGAQQCVLLPPRFQTDRFGFTIAVVRVHSSAPLPLRMPCSIALPAASGHPD